MADKVYAYRNVVSGDVFVFATERPDLDAVPNYEPVDADDVPEGLKEAAMREAAAAKSIGLDVQNAPVPGGAPDPGMGVYQVQASGQAPMGGVLSRNVVNAAKTQAELFAQAQADSESLALHGTLAAHIDDEVEETRVNLGGPEIDVINTKAVGDVKKSPVKRAGRAAKQRQEAKQAAPQNPPPKTP